jgi:hypothetical protein
VRSERRGADLDLLAEKPADVVFDSAPLFECLFPGTEGLEAVPAIQAVSPAEAMATIQAMSAAEAMSPVEAMSASRLH